MAGKPNTGGLVMFNRTDNGNVKPRANIEGPKTGIIRINQMQSYPPKGWIIVTHPGGGGLLQPENTFIGIWSVDDNGDVAPRWKLQGPNSRLELPNAVGLDPKHKELLVADKRLNAILIFYVPEIF